MWDDNFDTNYILHWYFPHFVLPSISVDNRLDICDTVILWAIASISLLSSVSDEHGVFVISELTLSIHILCSGACNWSWGGSGGGLGGGWICCDEIDNLRTTWRDVIVSSLNFLCIDEFAISWVPSCVLVWVSRWADFLLSLPCWSLYDKLCLDAFLLLLALIGVFYENTIWFQKW